MTLPFSSPDFCQNPIGFQQEMASEERKALDSKIMAENLHKSLGAEEQQAETDAFQCGRCKQVCPVIDDSCLLLTLNRENAGIAKHKLGAQTSR
jgi:hypothetical protein